MARKDETTYQMFCQHCKKWVTVYLSGGWYRQCPKCKAINKPE